MGKRISKILIANRGEIAVRIIRAARELGIRTVSVFSEADRSMPHTQMADETYSIGDSEPLNSYLNIDKIIHIAIESKSDAIHPGYGFLSENSNFAERVEKEGLIFIGPSATSILQMGNKIIARNFVNDLGVPLIPGTHTSMSDLALLKKSARDIGYPLLIKASAGGGGKGMRIVEKETDLAFSIERAQAEAREAFGNDEVFIEKYITSPHHVEIQVMADNFGNVIHLFERDCSIQRRHQKLVEESPSPFISNETRKKLTDAAVKITKACNYSGAGTIEFIVDENQRFYFLEMNTRLQVEHPVTEEITDIDIVKEQISIAEGNKLSFGQEDILQKKHAIELRIYAEDPENNFLPMNGVLDNYKVPKGPGIRIDDGYEEGLAIPHQYDSLIGKLIVFGNNRMQAIGILKRAINEYRIGKVPTTLKFGKILVENNEFLQGDYDTNYVSNLYKKLQDSKPNFKEEDIAAIAAVILKTGQNKALESDRNQHLKQSSWKRRKN